MKRRILLFLLTLALAVLLLAACGTNGETHTTPTESITTMPTDTTNMPSDTTENAVTTSSIAEQVSTTAKPSVTLLSPEEAKEMIDNLTVVIVDVRRADEYASGHIPNAILVPNETILQEAETALPDKNATILIYCRSGRRSAEAAEKLVSLGYTKVYDFGGILNWPYGTVTD